jgi:toxin ParE1/3/4
VSRALTLRPKAIADLAEIWAFTAAQWSESQAETYLTGLQALFDLLCSQPDMARLRHEITPPVRLFPYRAHLVIYQDTADSLHILRLVHGRAQWQAYLQD